jgi:hypothetical protein
MFPNHSPMVLFEKVLMALPTGSAQLSIQARTLSRENQAAANTAIPTNVRPKAPHASQ